MNLPLGNPYIIVLCKPFIKLLEKQFSFSCYWLFIPSLGRLTAVVSHLDECQRGIRLSNGREQVLQFLSVVLGLSLSLFACLSNFAKKTVKHLHYSRVEQFYVLVED